MTNEQEYITKDQAAKFLKLSPRRVLELAQQGDIEARESFNTETGRKQTVLSADDIRRIVQKRQSKVRIAAALPPAASGRGEIVNAAPPQLFAPPHFEPYQWLTVEEGAQRLRLPASAILHTIENGRLQHLDVGPRPGGRYRIKCADLDRLVGAD